ncbi:hypothetical protein B0H14DRAFT_2974159 [Mycena olivaceomarginata]|nr:hypothetical protein B0H14DRAFT_2974159 [Mycena olivaceomarginata]
MGERTPDTTIFKVSIHAHISNYNVKNVADVKENGKTKNGDVLVTWVRIGTSPAFTQYPSPNSQRSPEIRTAQAAHRFCRLRPGSSHRDLSECPIHAWQKSLARKAGTVEARGAYRLRAVRPLLARSRVIAANAAGAGAGDGKPPRGVLRIGRGVAESATSGALCR